MAVAAAADGICALGLGFVGRERSSGTQRRSVIITPLPANDRTSLPTMSAITIVEKADTPIWAQIGNRIKFLIRSGVYGPGDRLPSVRELAVELKINFNTVSKAYQNLERDGIIETKRGRGTFIADSGLDEEQLRKNPIELLIDELVSAADSQGMGNDELRYLIEKRLTKREAFHGKERDVEGQ